MLTCGDMKKHAEQPAEHCEQYLLFAWHVGALNSCRLAWVVADLLAIGTVVRIQCIFFHRF